MRMDPPSTSKSTVIQLYLSFYFFAIVSGIYISSYFQQPLTSIISFYVDDGWCSPESQGIGAHCFGDFYYPLAYINQNNPWSTGLIPAPPLGLFLLKPFGLIVDLFPSSAYGLVIFLGSLVLSILSIPIYLYKVKKLNASESILAGMMILSSAPIIVVLDRGNFLAICVPLIYFFLHFEKVGLSKKSFYFWIMLVLLKPHFALLGLVFLRGRNIKGAVKRWLLGFTIFCASFLLYPIGLKENFNSYFRQLVSYQEFASLGGIFPVNISIASSLSLFDAMLQTSFSKATTFVSIIIFITTVVIVYRSSTLLRVSIVFPVLLLPLILPQTSFHYYLVVLIPFYAFALLETLNRKIAAVDLTRKNTFSRLRNLSELALAIWPILLFAPWAIPWNVFASELHYVGTFGISMHWLLITWTLPIYLIGSLIYSELSRRQSSYKQ